MPLQDERINAVYDMSESSRYESQNTWGYYMYFCVVWVRSQSPRNCLVTREKEEFYVWDAP